MSKGRFVLGTVGAHWIGRSIALAIARAGANVVVHYWCSQAAAESIRPEVEALGRKVIFLQADLAQPMQISGMLPRILDAWCFIWLGQQRRDF